MLAFNSGESAMFLCSCAMLCIALIPVEARTICGSPGLILANYLTNLPTSVVLPISFYSGMLPRSLTKAVILLVNWFI